MRVCSKCKQEKDITEYGQDKRRKDGLNLHCKDCRRKHHQATYHKIAAKRLVIKYGITKDDYDRMFQEQLCKCAICSKPQEKCRRALSVDHCHKTGKVRGLLCDECNRALGYFYDDIKRLKNAITYLGGE
ncbi:endonuclease VII [Yersinia phage vB_YenP_Rambo]|uniref:Endonuclease VII n=1 Tax=Yersinia phage vB_YenP_Rambo TaxID=2880894 RepID=A0AC61TNV3_9CAUD|nr:endonuclease VII [Yersinia phage vB_YenP_Rambo]